MSKKGDADRFIGMWPHKATGGYEIKYCLNGEKKSEYAKSQAKAERRKEFWIKYFADRDFVKPPDPDGETHPAIFWERKLREAAEFILANPGNDVALDAGKVLASMATAGMRAAAYHPPPEIGGEDGHDGGNMSIKGGNENMTTEELKELLGKK
jgi:hypothetical protein